MCNCLKKEIIGWYNRQLGTGECKSKPADKSRPANTEADAVIDGNKCEKDTKPSPQDGHHSKCVNNAVHNHDWRGKPGA